MVSTPGGVSPSGLPNTRSPARWGSPASRTVGQTLSWAAFVPARPTQEQFVASSSGLSCRACPYDGGRPCSPAVGDVGLSAGCSPGAWTESASTSTTVADRAVVRVQAVDEDQVFVTLMVVAVSRPAC